MGLFLDQSRFWSYRSTPKSQNQLRKLLSNNKSKVFEDLARRALENEVGRSLDALRIDINGKGKKLTKKVKKDLGLKFDQTSSGSQ